MNDEFSRVLSQQMDYYSNDASADRINRMKGEIDQVYIISYNNIHTRYVARFPFLSFFVLLIIVYMSPCIFPSSCLDRLFICFGLNHTERTAYICM